MTNQELRALCFPDKFCLTLALSRKPSIASLAPGGIVSDDEPNSDSCCDENNNDGLFSSSFCILLQKLELISQLTNTRVATQLESRSGKIKQRWAIDPRDGQYVRLVTGCVPILRDGRILLIGSSSSGKGWLVPKGGWEDDEELEEGAIRESFEEAGVLGILGPMLDTFRVETRKARQRRLNSAEYYSDKSSSESEDRKETKPDQCLTDSCKLSSLIPTTHLINPAEGEKGQGDSPKLTHTHVIMTFFPLYVQSIHDVWPEDSRHRQAFTIDEAMEIIRPEFRLLLSKVKNSGLHMVDGDESISEPFGPSAGSNFSACVSETASVTSLR